MARSTRAYGVRPPRAATSRRDFRIPQDPAVSAYLDERRCLGKGAGSSRRRIFISAAFQERTIFVDLPLPVLSRLDTPKPMSGFHSVF